MAGERRDLSPWLFFRKEAGGRMADRDGNLLLWCGITAGVGYCRRGRLSALAR
jgi:hypothetical protein